MSEPASGYRLITPTNKGDKQTARDARLNDKLLCPCLD